MESLSLDLGELTDTVALALISIPDQDWVKLAATEPELAERFGRALIVLNHRAFRVLQLLQYQP